MKWKWVKLDENSPILRSNYSMFRRIWLQSRRPFWILQKQSPCRRTHALNQHWHKAIPILSYRRFDLQNQLDEVLPKIENIKAYEQKIDQMTRTQILWSVLRGICKVGCIDGWVFCICRDDSPEMREFREQKAEMDILSSKYAKIDLTIQSLEEANRALEELNA